MDLGEIFALVFGAAGLVGVLYAVLTYLQQSPKRRVTLSTRESQVLPTRVSDFGELTIYHAGHEVEDPRFVDVSIEATGRADVPSSRFDTSSPLVLDCGKPILAQTGDAGAVLKIDHQKISFGPLLLKKGVPLKIRLLVDGPPSCDWEDPKLIDTKVQFVSNSPAAVLKAQRSEDRKLMIGIGAIFVCVFLAILLDPVLFK